MVILARTERGKQPTIAQIAVIASILSYLLPVGGLAKTLEDWLANHHVSPDVVGDFFQSRHWSETLDRARRADCGFRSEFRQGDGPARQVDPRRDYSVKGILRVFCIDSAEAAELDLKQLLTERERSAKRRAEKGVAIGRRGRPVDPERPAGMSRSTWNRRKRAAEKAQHEAVAAMIESDPQNGTKFDHISGTKFEAGQGEGPFGEYINKDPVEYRVIGSATLTYYLENLRPPPEFPQTVAAPRPANFASEEGARLAAMAERLGLVWTATIHPELVRKGHPDTWWMPPEGLTLTDAERKSIDAAVEDVRQAIFRLGSIDRLFVQPPKIKKPRPEGDDPRRPSRVSVEVWSAVPEIFRGDPRLTKVAGRKFEQGMPADLATVAAVRELRRRDACTLAVMANAPDIDPRRVAKAAFGAGATAYAVDKILETFAREDSDRAVLASALEAAIDEARPPIPADVRAAVMEHAMVWLPDALYRSCEQRDPSLVPAAVLARIAANQISKAFVSLAGLSAARRSAEAAASGMVPPIPGEIEAIVVETAARRIALGDGSPAYAVERALQPLLKERDALAAATIAVVASVEALTPPIPAAIMDAVVARAAGILAAAPSAEPAVAVAIALDTVKRGPPR